MSSILLGVNIDHVATLRQARGTRYPDPVQAAMACRYLGVREVVPIHWGTFPVLTGRPEELERELADRELACELVTLQPGDRY